jgi:hypothetical protein
VYFIIQQGEQFLLFPVEQGGLYVLNLIDQYLGGFPWLVIGVVELFCIGWVYGKELIIVLVILINGMFRR